MSCHRPNRRVLFAALALGAAGLANVARGEIVRLNDGQSHAGRILEENEVSIRLRTGSPTGPREISLAKSQITTIHRGVEEAPEISRCADAALLGRWCEGYFHADTPALAVQCIERAIQVEPALRNSPCPGGSPEFQLFWNKQIFRIRLSQENGGSGVALLDLARWADAAGLTADARETLRRAAFVDAKNPDIHQLAEQWNVRLEPWITPDLTPALEMNLFTKGIRDENMEVEALPDHEFLLLPLQYEADSARRVLSRLVLDSKDRSAYYGIFSLHRQPTAAVMQSLMDFTAFERMELRSAADGAPQVVWKNNLAPRIRDGDATRQEPIRSRPESERPDGWAVLILELRAGRADITLEWGDGSRETIDLVFLRAAREAAAIADRQSATSPDVETALGFVRSGSAAMAELALVQLALIRQRLPAARAAEWSRTISERVIEAALRPELRVQQAAWRYFALQTDMLSAAIESFERANQSTQRRWLDIFERRAAAPSFENSAAAVRILHAFLKTGSPEICERALDVMRRLNVNIDWNRVSQSSKNAQLAALRQLAMLRRDEAVSALLTIMKSVRRSSAQEVAKYVRSLNLNLRDPRDPLLKKWRDLKSDADRISLITVLRPADLGDLIYSQSFADIIHSALRPRKDGSRLQREVLGAVVELVARYEAQAASIEERGRFPLPVRVRVADPIVAALSAAARHDSSNMRFEAICSLIKSGHATLAAEAMLDPAGDQETPAKMLEKIIARRDVVSTDGFFALCGRLLQPDHADLAGPILSTLSAVAAERPTADHWRIVVALRAGTDIEQLGELTAKLKPSVAVGATRWLHQLGHFSLQDGQRFGAAGSSLARRALLQEMDLRRAQLVDGTYGVVAVVESTVSVDYPLYVRESAEPLRVNRWSVPRRDTLPAPSLRLVSTEQGEDYSVFWDESALGRGRSRTSTRAIRRPGGFLPALIDPSKSQSGIEGWGWPPPTLIAGFNPEEATGPVVLPGNRPVLDEPAEDFMTLDISAYLREILRNSDQYSPADLARPDETPIRITLRYAGFGAYAGVTPARPLTAAEAPGQRNVIGVMLLLEKME